MAQQTLPATLLHWAPQRRRLGQPRLFWGSGFGRRVLKSGPEVLQELQGPPETSGQTKKIFVTLSHLLT